MKMPPITSGMFLVSSPTMLDPNFARTVVLVCAHGPQGSLGIVINRPTGIAAEQFIPGVPGVCYAGGPVARDEAAFLHRFGSAVSGAVEVAPGISFGGELDDLRELAAITEDAARQWRIYLGYAGWGEGQLDLEISEGGWIVCPARGHYVFDFDAGKIWSQVLSDLGVEGRFLASLPMEPRLN